MAVLRPARYSVRIGWSDRRGSMGILPERTAKMAVLSSLHILEPALVTTPAQGATPPESGGEFCRNSPPQMRRGRRSADGRGWC